MGKPKSEIIVQTPLATELDSDGSITTVSVISHVEFEPQEARRNGNAVSFSGSWAMASWVTEADRARAEKDAAWVAEAEKGGMN